MDTLPNQVWITDEGRHVLIVWTSTGNKMLWLDGNSVGGHIWKKIWTVSPINRLREMTMLTPDEFFQRNSNKF